jgi:hypothetical protein
VVVWCLRPRASYWDAVVSSNYPLFCYRSNGQPKLFESKICKSCQCSTTLKFRKNFCHMITQLVIDAFAIWYEWCSFDKAYCAPGASHFSTRLSTSSVPQNMQISFFKAKLVVVWNYICTPPLSFTGPSTHPIYSGRWNFQTQREAGSLPGRVTITVGWMDCAVACRYFFLLVGPITSWSSLTFTLGSHLLWDNI